MAERMYILHTHTADRASDSVLMSHANSIRKTNRRSIRSPPRYDGNPSQQKSSKRKSSSSSFLPVQPSAITAGLTTFSIALSHRPLSPSLSLSFGRIRLALSLSRFVCLLVINL